MVTLTIYRLNLYTMNIVKNAKKQTAGGLKHGNASSCSEPILRTIHATQGDVFDDCDGVPKGLARTL